MQTDGKTTDATDATEETAPTTPTDNKEVNGWCLSHFWVGQTLSNSSSENSNIKSHRIRKLISIFLPLTITHVFWWSYAIITNSFHIFTQEINGIPRYYMSITMILGSFIAGATAEGGASVAFPVMTLAFAIAPVIARDFSFMIQSVGMTAAAFSILFMRIKIEFKSIIYCGIGGLFGIIFCLAYIAHHLPPPFSKMYFVSIWFSFAFSLFYLNRTHDRKVWDTIPRWDKGTIRIFSSKKISICINWKAIVLLFAGFIGGIFSGIAGSGIDICSFAVLTLLFRVTEKTATPTSIVLMAINTSCGFAFRYLMEELPNESWSYFFVCIPIVVVGAPLGSIIGSYLHREVLASFVYVTDTVQLIAAFIIVKPWDISMFLFISSIVFIIFGGIIFSLITKIGLKIMNNIVQNESKTKDISNLSKISSLSQISGLSQMSSLSQIEMDVRNK